MDSFGWGCTGWWRLRRHGAERDWSGLSRATGTTMKYPPEATATRLHSLAATSCMNRPCAGSRTHKFVQRDLHWMNTRPPCPVRKYATPSPRLLEATLEGTPADLRHGATETLRFILQRSGLNFQIWRRLLWIQEVAAEGSVLTTRDLSL